MLTPRSEQAGGSMGASLTHAGGSASPAQACPAHQTSSPQAATPTRLTTGCLGG